MSITTLTEFPMAPRETSGRTRTASDAPILSADAYVQAVGSFLESEQPAAAKEMAALAVELFPGHAELEKMNRVLNPSQVTVSSYQGPDRTWEFDWLRRNRDAYRGQWVALGGGELIAASDNVQDLIRAVRARDLDGHPLVHCVE